MTGLTWLDLSFLLILRDVSGYSVFGTNFGSQVYWVGFEIMHRCVGPGNADASDSDKYYKVPRYKINAYARLEARLPKYILMLSEPKQV